MSEFFTDVTEPIPFAGAADGDGLAYRVYDPDREGRSAGVAYRLTLSQFSDVAAQEMRRDPGADLDLDRLWDTGRHVLGPGRYESLHVVGR